jgi:hypothetical protein
MDAGVAEEQKYVLQRRYGAVIMSLSLYFSVTLVWFHEWIFR